MRALYRPVATGELIQNKRKMSFYMCPGSRCHNCGGKQQQGMMVPYNSQTISHPMQMFQLGLYNMMSEMFSDPEEEAEVSITQKKWVIVQTSSGPRRVRVTNKLHFSS
ncbi:hypothetical protein SRHO_G00154320 [Serrasalmus rhombeus]